MPTAAVTQTIAAVVSPRTTSPRTKMRPPPMKPMPDTTWAAMRDGSRIVRPGTSTSPKPYLLTSMKSAAPTPTSVWVRRPADFWRHSRSSPISVDRTKASPSSPDKRPIRAAQTGTPSPALGRGGRPDASGGVRES
jgi:hypothetical protein